MPFCTEHFRIRDDTTLLVLARKKRDAEIYRKPNMSLYFELTKARDDDIYVEYGRVQKKYKTIYSVQLNIILIY